MSVVGLKEGQMARGVTSLVLAVHSLLATDLGLAFSLSKRLSM